MCRILAYLGPPVTLDALLIAPEHSLLRQSWAPRHQRHGTVNADGFGVGWYEPTLRLEPARYRRARPMWGDPSFASLAGVVRSGAVLGAVRSATPPLAVADTNTAPFTAGRWLFAHNGSVEGFCDGPAVKLRTTISPRRAAAIEGATDSELLFAMVLDRLDAGTEPGKALAEVIDIVTRVAPARLNMFLTDGERLVATARGDSLFVLDDAGVARDATIVASEPFDDDPAWLAVPDQSVVRATAHDHTIGTLLP